MHIQPNKGEMATLQTPTVDEEMSTEETGQDTSNDGTEECCTDDSESVESLGNETLSSSLRYHPYGGRVLCEVAEDGKKTMDKRTRIKMYSL